MSGPEQLLVHVIPINDLEPHEETETCKCQPKIEDGVCIHNSYDGREIKEQNKLN